MPDDGALDGPRRRAGFTGPATRVAGRGGERTLAAAAHAAIGFGLLGIGFLVSLVITGVIWLAGRRSPYVQEHADRAGRYQIFVLLVNVVVVGLWAAGLGLVLYLDLWGQWDAGGPRAVALTLVSLLLLATAPAIVAWYFGTIAYGLYAALRVFAGHDFRYPPPPWRRRRRPPRRER
jgi:uncharacterized Tic20 family protein